MSSECHVNGFCLDRWAQLNPRDNARALPIPSSVAPRCRRYFEINRSWNHVRTLSVTSLAATTNPLARIAGAGRRRGRAAVQVVLQDGDDAGVRIVFHHAGDEGPQLAISTTSTDESV